MLSFVWGSIMVAPPRHRAGTRLPPPRRGPRSSMAIRADCSGASKSAACRLDQGAAGVCEGVCQDGVDDVGGDLGEGAEVAPGAAFVGPGDVLWRHLGPHRVEGGQDGLNLGRGEWRDVLAGQDSGGKFRYPLEGLGASGSGQDEGGGCAGVGCQADVAHTGMGNTMTASRPAAMQPTAAARSPHDSQDQKLYRTQTGTTASNQLTPTRCHQPTHSQAG